MWPSSLADVEHAIGHALFGIANILQRMGSTLSSAPISTNCNALSVSVSNFSFRDLSGPQLSLLSLSTALSIVIILTTIFRYFNYLPILDPVPPPSARFDADIDQQSESFTDEDVRPQLCSPNTANTIACINPGSGQNLGHIACTDVADIDKMIKVSKNAQKEWSASSFDRRRAILKVLRNYILYEQNSICNLSCRDTGKTTLEANLGEILPTLEKLRWLSSKEAEKSITKSNRSTGPLAIHKVAYVEYVPLGCILAISPWNYPFHNLMNPISAALFSGNSIIVKPSEHTVFSSVHYVRIVRRILSLCGESPELVQCCIGGPDVGKYLVEHKEINKIFFTGSTNIGKQVALSAAYNLVPTCLELGGKDACIICEDIHISQILPICLRGIFQNAGQNCIGLERFYVHSGIKEQFIEYAENKVKEIRPGIDMGAMTMGEPAIKIIEELLAEAVGKGAKVITGGKRILSSKGFYFEPTILDGVTNDMRIAKEEVFGPIMSIFEWTDEKDVVKFVNDCPFGLGCSIFTNNSRRGEAILSQLQVGMGNINDYASNYLCQSMPFGGTKDSGSDRFAGIEGLRGCCLVKASTRDRFSWMKTTIPKTLQYPQHENATEFAAELNDLIYRSSLMSKMDNVRNIIGMILFPSWRPRTIGSG